MIAIIFHRFFAAVKTAAIKSSYTVTQFQKDFSDDLTTLKVIATRHDSHGPPNIRVNIGLNSDTRRRLWSRKI